MKTCIQMSQSEDTIEFTIEFSPDRKKKKKKLSRNGKETMKKKDKIRQIITRDKTLHSPQSFRP